MPPLPRIADYKLKDSVSKTAVEVAIGTYDDPSNQVQPAVSLNLTAGNIMVIGSAQTGKTLLLQTILRGIAENYSPEQASVYILDFASKAMQIYGKLNHVGGVVTDGDDEKIKNFFKIMGEEIALRKEQFSRLGIGSFEAYLETAEKRDLLPQIVIMADNLSALTYRSFRRLQPLARTHRLPAGGGSVGIVLLSMTIIFVSYSNSPKPLDPKIETNINNLTFSDYARLLYEYIQQGHVEREGFLDTEKIVTNRDIPLFVTAYDADRLDILYFSSDERIGIFPDESGEGIRTGKGVERERI